MKQRRKLSIFDDATYEQRHGPVRPLDPLQFRMGAIASQPKPMDELLIEAPLCPRDGAPLSTQRQLEIDYRSCGHCGGLWFARDDLQRFELRSPEASLPPALSTPEPRTASASGPARCICRQRPVMIEAVRQGVTIDICPSCNGIWLDAGEIEEILQGHSSAELASRLPYRPNRGLGPGDAADGTWALGLTGEAINCLLAFLADV